MVIKRRVFSDEGDELFEAEYSKYKKKRGRRGMLMTAVGGMFGPVGAVAGMAVSTRGQKRRDAKFAGEVYQKACLADLETGGQYDFMGSAKQKIRKNYLVR